jgi:uncharacterized membrane protein YgcG
MLKRRIICALVSLAWLASGACHADAASQGSPHDSIPPIPQYYLLDEASLLTPKQQKALATILIEHDHVSGQQIVVAIFKRLPRGDVKEDASAYSRRVFDEWQVGKRGQDNGALIVVYAEEKKARIEAGYGLDALDDAHAGVILRDFMAPELRAGHPYRAIGLSVLELLRVIGSPLIESGRAEQLLELGGIQGSFKPVAHGLGTGRLTWLAMLAIGLVFFAMGLCNIVAAEAHFTGEGWYKPNPWKGLAPRSLAKKLNDRRKRPRIGAGGVPGEW